MPTILAHSNCAWPHYTARSLSAVLGIRLGRAALALQPRGDRRRNQGGARSALEWWCRGIVGEKVGAARDHVRLAAHPCLRRRRAAGPLGGAKYRRERTGSSPMLPRYIAPRGSEAGEQLRNARCLVGTVRHAAAQDRRRACPVPADLLARRQAGRGDLHDAHRRQCDSSGLGCGLKPNRGHASERMENSEPEEGEVRHALNIASRARDELVLFECPTVSSELEAASKDGARSRAAAVRLRVPSASVSGRSTKQRSARAGGA